MKMIKSTCFVLTCIFIICSIKPQSAIAQESIGLSNASIHELFQIAESNYPVNDEFINGAIYPLPNILILGDPYLGSTQWYEGTLFINNKEYPQMILKYDLIIDELVVKTKADGNIERLITVNKSQVDSFHLGSSLFINSRNIFPNEKKYTYVEIVYRGKLSVYKQYEKAFIDMYSTSSPAGKFSSQKCNTYLFDSGKLVGINSTKSFLAYFEKTDQSKIKKFLKANDINYKKISDSQFIDLMVFCTTLITN